MILLKGRSILEQSSPYPPYPTWRPLFTNSFSCSKIRRYIVMSILLLFPSVEYHHPNCGSQHQYSYAPAGLNLYPQYQPQDCCPWANAGTAKASSIATITIADITILITNLCSSRQVLV
jgi:hypothetical protein